MNENLILTHYKSPLRYGKPESFDLTVSAANQTCGDEITFYASKSDDRLTKISFTGSGCSICLASASVLLDMVSTKRFSELSTITEADLLYALDIPKEHKRSSCVLLSFTALQKLLKEA